MKQAVLPTILVLLLSLGGCSSKDSKELTRSKAADLIKANKHFPQTVTNQFQVGSAWFVDRSKSFDGVLASPGQGIYLKALLGQGLVAVEWQGMVTPQSTTDPMGQVWIELTPKGSQYLVGAANVDKSSKLPQYVPVKMCELEFDRVTGLSSVPNSEGMMQVNYKFRYANKTPFESLAEETGNLIATCQAPDSRDAAVIMRRYDDGWRYESDTFLH